MQDKTINSALLALRKQIIRSDGKGLKQVETLLALRGVHMPAVLPAKRQDAAGNGLMAYWVLQALEGGPLPFRGVVDHVAALRPEISYEAACSRTGQALNKLKKRGRVSLEGGLWLATPIGGCQGAPNPQGVRIHEAE